MTNEKAVAEKLLQVQAVKLSPDAPFTWASGWKSPIYCDNRKVLSFPFVRDFIKSELCNVLFEYFPHSYFLKLFLLISYLKKNNFSENSLDFSFISLLLNSLVTSKRLKYKTSA